MIRYVFLYILFWAFMYFSLCFTYEVFREKIVKNGWSHVDPADPYGFLVMGIPILNIAFFLGQYMTIIKAAIYEKAGVDGILYTNFGLFKWSYHDDKSE